jgi:FMN phosphatase YigB (HAD superfamily)
MIKAVLLDLDDTLLRLDAGPFVERYLVGLADLIVAAYPSLADASLPVDKAIKRATRATIGNLDPTRTNAQVFLQVVSELLDLPADEILALFETFYNGAYVRLSDMASPIPTARTLVARLLDMGLAVVIATNPVFPLKALWQRLAWAGLDTPHRPYALVTGADMMHFTKPHPHFYEEILARVGVEADEAIMVGDDLTNDMLPAAQAGLSTFLIDGNTTAVPPDPDGARPDGSGTLADFDGQVSAGWLATLHPWPRTAEQVIPRMLGDVGALFGLIANINPAYWHMRPDPNEWSPLETLCHLRDSERSVQRPRLQRIAAEDNPFISQPQDPPGPGERDLTGEEGHAALREFWDERCQTLDFIQSLRPEDWSRPARHSIFGPTTLLEMAHFTTRHDHLHINQLCETIGRCR